MLNMFSLRLAMALDQKNPATPAAIYELSDTLAAISSDYLQRISSIAAELTNVASQSALQAAPEGLDAVEIEDVLLHTDTCIEALMESLNRCAERDATSCVNELRKVALKVMLGNGNVSYVRARMGSLAALKFEQTDSLGRRWASQIYVRSVMRGTATRVKADAVVLAANQKGDTELYVFNPDGSNDGLRFSIKPGSSLPDYLEVRETILHPNTNATVKRY